MTLTNDILMFCTNVKDEYNREVTNGWFPQPNPALTYSNIFLGEDLIQFNCCVNINAIADCIVVSLPR